MSDCKIRAHGAGEIAAPPAIRLMNDLMLSGIPSRLR